MYSSGVGAGIVRSVGRSRRNSYLCTRILYSTEPEVKESRIPVSTAVGQAKEYDPKLKRIIEDISRLTLLEVSDLNELLKKTLNIPDTPVMGPMSMGAFQPAAAAPAEEEEVAAPKKVQTSFTLKLMKFDDGKKVALIKEVKSLLEGMNLVQAKKFVESAPTIIKADLSKEEAEKLKAAFEAVGATCEIA
jgi:large subunit ribosomal protein L7/L12